MSAFAFDRPEEALEALASRLSSVDAQSSAAAPVGRILASDVVADRDSPAADVSAMDGYAVRRSDLARGRAISVVAESVPGSPPPELPAGSAVRIFTGAIVPAGAEAVVKREDTEETADSIVPGEAAVAAGPGEHIRRAGENAAAGSQILAAGTRITAASCAAMANFGVYAPPVYRPVRVSILTSGDEVGLFEDMPPQPWQLRNSNRFSLRAVFDRPGLDVESVEHCRDDAGLLEQTLARLLAESDAVVLSGGVSMGDYDHVPEVVRRVGGEIVFHGLPIRPGKPILGAVTDQGKLVLGLPGNPVSATIGAHRFALPLLAKIAGQTDWRPQCPVVELHEAGDQTLPLHWFRLVRLTAPGVAAPVISRGSGDLVSLGDSSGYVEIRKGQSGSGPWPYYSW